MLRRHFVVAPVLAAPVLLLQARAQGLADISDFDAGKGLRTALEKGAVAAVQLLGRPDGFLGNPQVRIPLPRAIQDVSRLLSAFGMRKQLEELEVSMNRAAETAVPMAKNLLVNAVKNISVSDAKRILSGGDTSVTEFFADKTRQPLTGTFLPVVHQATAKVGVVEKYERISQKAQGVGLYRPEDPTVDHYVTRKALDGLYFMIGEEEKKIRRDPVGTGSALLAKVFGGLR
ncbi:DUF4197 domain-containing protein [Ramlibacter sp. USB13]|uniref:DUF4197 domain-containing protein n=1 Tax=Ramlibacter cellulosilyticus TaxID=2764187 RepID=A0A923SAK1_9BURK|nr:DUF4197 domain-containing protein [Ramlibacter cellulosilyticus]MBC5782859.1 DUF4197 domain-containing protein [Ramlibacter cellulosilyticus]